MGMRRVIEADLRSWSREVLEVPNPHLRGLPACPYAAKAWRDSKVEVIETDTLFAAALRACADFDGRGKDLVVVASFNIPDLAELGAFSQELNRQFPDLHCMTFHPDYGAEDAELDFLTDNDWESAVDESYAMVFIQDLRLVVAASDRLIPLGYYDAYPRDEYEALVLHRKRRLTHGDETSCDEARRRSEENDARRQG